jgi:long-chain acyl-CoA synthetase
MIVNAGGKNIYPGPIEDLFVTSKWIEQFVVVGENQPYMAALVVPDFDMLEPWAAEKDIPYDSMPELVSRKEVQELFKDEITDYSKELASYEKIRNFRLIPHEFTIEDGEITPTLKVKRRIVTKKYQNLIDEMFS